MRGRRIGGLKKGWLIVGDIDIDIDKIKQSNWEVCTTSEFIKEHPCYKVFWTEDEGYHYTKNPKCPICNEGTIGVFYQDRDEGFYIFVWKCPNGHHLDSTNPVPKCPYCGGDTIYLSFESYDNVWNRFWGCGCEGVRNEEKIANGEY